MLIKRKSSCDQPSEHVAVSLHKQIQLGQDCQAAGMSSPCDTSGKYKDNLPAVLKCSCIWGRDKGGQKPARSSLQGFPSQRDTKDLHSHFTKEETEALEVQQLICITKRQKIMDSSWRLTVAFLLLLGPQTTGV